MMNPHIVRRRIPSAIRRLLTDIGPKGDWTDAEPDTVTRDGIVLPTRGAASGQEVHLSPAENPGGEETVNTSRKSAVCMLCKCSPSCYTCPRCNLHYCSLACYRSPDHIQCSEEFYKEAVLRELKDIRRPEGEERKKMQEVLVRLKRKADQTNGGMGSLLKEAGIVSDDRDDGEVDETKKVQVLEYLSRLAELQQTGEGSATEVDAILGKVEEIGGEPLSEDIDEESAESAEGDLDLADRLSGLDINKLSEEELWELLNSKERELFMGLLKGGTIGGLVPLWKPWWEEHDEGGSSLVELLEEEKEKSTTTDELDIKKVKTSAEVVPKLSESASKSGEFKGGKRKRISKGEGRSSVPPISAQIPKLNSLCVHPSPTVCYGLINAMYAYTFTLFLLNNDTDSLIFEFCDIVLALSEALNSNRVFNSIQEALDCGETLILRGGYLDREDPRGPARALEAVVHIMTGRDGKDTSGYCLAALSQLLSVLSQARKALSKEEGERRRKYFLASKKCEFFQAWALDNVRQIRTLAIELWNEHGKRNNVRVNMEKAKAVVEKNMNKEKIKGKSKLIEELN